MNLLGLEKSAEDQATGAVANFHTIGSYTVDLRHKICVAVLLAYVSKKAYDGGRNPLFQTTSTVPGLPAEDLNITDWIYAELVSERPESPESAPGAVSNFFAGARLVSVSDAEVPDGLV